MKNRSIFSLTAFLALALTACPGGTGGSGTPALTSISGQISNWLTGKTGTLGTLVSSSGGQSPVQTQATIDASGNFKIDLPSTDAMAPLISAGSVTNPCAGVTATPNVKGAGLNLIIQNASKANIGNVFLASTDPSVPGTTSYTVAIYFYVNSDWNASGSCTTTAGSTTSTFNIQAKAGWNIVIGTVTQGAITYTNGAIPSNVKWISTGDLTKLGLTTFNFNQFFSR
jgi:hypothetical protein